jgi:hypothetical protein
MPVGNIDMDGNRRGGSVVLDRQIQESIRRVVKLTKQIRRIERKHRMFEGGWIGLARGDSVKLTKLRKERDRCGPLALLEKRAVSIETRGLKYRFGYNNARSLE